MISELKVGDLTTGFYFVSDLPILRKSKKNTDYLCLVLQDKSGTIDARLWDVPPGTTAQQYKAKFVKVRGEVSEWNEEKQLKVDQIRFCDVSDNLNMGDFFERSERDPSEMLAELRRLLVDEIDGDHPLLKLCLIVLKKNEERLLVAPAGKSVHHAYIGGLLEHVLSMCRSALLISSHYDLDKALMLSACVLHDIGKIYELTFPIGIGYSTEGTLLGHISIGMELVAREIRLIEHFPDSTRMAILHLIASHHGLLEYGSPKVPLMKEAIAFHVVDMLDAKMAICDKTVKKGIDENQLTEWSRELGGPLYVLPEEQT